MGNPNENNNKKKDGGGLSSVDYFKTRTVILRSAFVVSLIVAACLCGALSYYTIRETERQVGIETYESVSDGALTLAQDNTLKRLRGAEVTATILSYAFPSARQWPMEIALNGFQHIAKKVTKLSEGRALGLIPIVQPSQIPQFEELASRIYAQQNYPPSAGSKQQFGFGVWKRSEASPYDDGKMPDTTGITSYPSNYTFLAPVLEHVKITTPALLFNVHSEIFRGTALDSMMQCVEQYNNNLNANANAKSTSIAETTTSEANLLLNETTTTTQEEEEEEAMMSPECWVVTEWLELNGFPGIKAGLIYLPIFPANDPTQIVGMIGTSLLWELDILANIVPTYISGLTCVISTQTNSYTYRIQQGIPEFVGEGDLHDPNYDEFLKETTLTDFHTSATASASYTLSVYPTQEMFQVFETDNAFAVSLSFVGVILLCSVLFWGYDLLMRRESHQRKMILEMKRRFVRFISHEIRTPLNTVTMGLELLGSEITEEQNKDTDVDSTGTDPMTTKEDIGFWLDLIRDIRENTYNAIAVLNDLLQYDKIENNSLKLEFEPVPISELLEKTVNSFRIQAVNKGIDMDLVWESSSSDPIYVDDNNCLPPPNNNNNDEEDKNKAVVGDPVRLAQVFRNMISNALKFTPSEGNIIITASYHREGLPNAVPHSMGNDGKDYEPELASTNPRAGSIMIQVKDSGSGMSKAQLEQLFAEGVQFDANRLQAGSGSGLGLCIAKGIVEKHGGYIKASSPGWNLGSVFTVELPLYKINMEETGFQKEQDRASATPTDASTALLSVSSNKDADVSSSSSIRQQPRPKFRILVAEDSESSRKMLIRLLERSGHSCVPAANGRQAVDAVLNDTVASKENKKHTPFDLILMDFEMPLMTGPEATLEIRKLGYSGVIFGVTGNVLREDVDHFLQSGADSVLAKPISLSSLNKHFDEHCQKRSVQHSSKQQEPQNHEYEIKQRQLQHEQPPSHDYDI